MSKTKKEKMDNVFLNKMISIDEEEQIKQEKKKAKEREKRIKQSSIEKKKEEHSFDEETELVLGMTNKNHKEQRQALQKKIDKQERIKRKRRKRIIKIIKWMGILGLLAGGIAFALISPIFNIQKIDVHGNNLVSNETIISLSELSQNQNIFRFVKKVNEEKIKENPYVQNVSIKRVLPNGINIEIEERERIANVEFMNGYAYIDSQGHFLEISNNKLELPIIQGAKTPEEQFVAGNRLEIQDLEKLEVAMKIISIWKNNGIEQPITNIDISNRMEYTMYLEQEKKKIYIGDGSNISNKILWIQAIINDNKGIEGEIYVNGDLNGNFKPRFKQKV